VGDPAEGEPLPGIRVAVVGHPEYGQTQTRDNGEFDLVVNGGTPLVIELRAPDFLPVQRHAAPDHHRFAPLGDVAMASRDLMKTRVTPGYPTYQIVRSTSITDGSGTRSATVLVPPGTTSPDLSVPSWTFRSTEYTVGVRGPKAMPAELPKTSGYTYAAELSIDEAEGLGLSTVRFSNPIQVYVDDFLDFAVGRPVPSGWYDRTRGVWIPEPTGRVVAILSTTGGIAHLDVNGDGQEDEGAPLDALGIKDAERTALAAAYPGVTNKALWRVDVKHFSPVDFNWPFSTCPPPSASCETPSPPDAPGPEPDGPKPDPCQASGSVIECENQVLGEILPLAATPYNLRYQSDRALGRKPSIRIPLPGPPGPPNATSVSIIVDVAGVKHEITRPKTDPFYDFFWNRMDAYGRVVQGAFEANVTVGYTYTTYYGEDVRTSGVFGEPGTAPIASNPARQEITLANAYRVQIGGLDAKPFGLGGLMLDAHHSSSRRPERCTSATARAGTSET
jgi:hypothetical protein